MKLTMLGLLKRLLIVEHIAQRRENLERRQRVIREQKFQRDRVLKVMNQAFETSIYYIIVFKEVARYITLTLSISSIAFIFQVLTKIPHYVNSSKKIK